jgi:hypothetical protein
MVAPLGDIGAREKAPAMKPGLKPDQHGVPEAYFRAVETDENVLFRLVPRACTVAMIATEIPAAIRPYSIAVAPDSFRMNRIIEAFIDYSFHVLSGTWCLRRASHIKPAHFENVNPTTET